MGQIAVGLWTATGPSLLSPSLSILYFPRPQLLPPRIWVAFLVVYPQLSLPEGIVVTIGFSGWDYCTCPFMVIIGLRTKRPRESFPGVPHILLPASTECQQSYLFLLIRFNYPYQDNDFFSCLGSSHDL